MAYVCIYFIGIGMAYRKTSAGEERWHVLFPFNDCHTLKLYAFYDGEEEFLGSFGGRKTKIEIEVSNADSRTGSSPKFDKYVLNLSRLHGKLKKNNDWDKNGALLTMENAVFGVFNKYLQEYPKIRDLEVFMAHGNDKIMQGLLAHMTSANINLGGNGTFKIEVNGKNIFSSKKGIDYKFVFDNDCRNEAAPHFAEGDLDLLYKLFSDANIPGRKFTMEGRIPFITPDPEIPDKEDFCELLENKRIIQMARTGFDPDLLTNKPCMFTQADGNNLP